MYASIFRRSYTTRLPTFIVAPASLAIRLAVSLPQDVYAHRALMSIARPYSRSVFSHLLFNNIILSAIWRLQARFVFVTIKIAQDGKLRRSHILFVIIANDWWFFSIAKAKLANEWQRQSKVQRITVLASRAAGVTPAAFTFTPIYPNPYPTIYPNLPQLLTA